MLSLSAGDVLQIDDTDRGIFSLMLRISLGCGWMKISSKISGSCGGKREADNAVSSGFIRVAFAHPALLRDVMHHLNSREDLFIPDFPETDVFSCIAVFASKKAFFLCCWAECFLWPGEWGISSVLTFPPVEAAGCQQSFVWSESQLKN